MEEKIVLADGKEYVIKPFNVGDFIEIEKKFGNLQLNTEKIEPVIFWLWLAVRKVHKDLTLEKLYELIDAPFIANEGIVNVFEKLTKLNAWDKIPKNVVSPAEKEQVSKK